MYIHLPRNAAVYFVFGVLCVGFSGFWTGGAHQQQLAAAADAAAFRAGTAQAEGAVRAAYNETERGGYDIDYNFAIPDGRIYEGTFASDRRLAEGTPVSAEYAVADPSVSREIHHAAPSVSAFPLEWLGAAFGALILFLMAKFGLRDVGASPELKLAFVAAGLIAYAGGLGWGWSMRQVRYTVQFGNQAWASPSFTNDFIPGVRLRLDGNGLYVNDRPYGVIPNHAHVWLREDGVFVNGKPIR